VGQKLRLKPLSVHVLPTRTSEDVLAEMTQDLVRQDIPLEAITIEHMDDLIRGGSFCAFTRKDDSTHIDSAAQYRLFTFPYRS
jgi:hypothetical protein